MTALRIPIPSARDANRGVRNCFLALEDHLLRVIPDLTADETVTGRWTFSDGLKTDNIYEATTSAGVTFTGNIHLGSYGIGNDTPILTFAAGAGGLATFTGAVAATDFYVPTTGEVGMSAKGRFVFTDDTQDVVVLTDAFLGIGVTPAYSLDILTGDTYGWQHSNGTVDLASYIGSSAAWIGTRSNHPLHFYTNDGTQIATVTTDGNFLMYNDAQVQLSDSGTYIYSRANTILNIVSDGTIEVSGAVEMDSTLTMSGDIYMGANGIGNNASVLTFATTGSGLATFGGAVTAANYYGADGFTVGIVSNELITFNAAGTIVVSGADFGVASTGKVYVGTTDTYINAGAADYLDLHFTDDDKGCRFYSGANLLLTHSRLSGAAPTVTLSTVPSTSWEFAASTGVGFRIRGLASHRSEFPYHTKFLDNMRCYFGNDLDAYLRHTNTNMEYVTTTGAHSFTGGHVFLANAASLNTVAGNQAAVATNATDGFLYIPTCAGAPTGSPTSYTGKGPIIYDTTNDALYIYDAAWATIGGGDYLPLDGSDPMEGDIDMDGNSIVDLQTTGEIQWTATEKIYSAGAGILTLSADSYIEVTNDFGMAGFHLLGAAYVETVAIGHPIPGLALECDSIYKRNSGVIVNTTRVTTTYTILASDEAVYCDTDGGAFTATLPPGVEGTKYEVVNCGSSGNALTLNIHGATLLVSLIDGESVTIVYNATEGWEVF